MPVRRHRSTSGLVVRVVLFQAAQRFTLEMRQRHPAPKFASAIRRLFRLGLAVLFAPPQLAVHAQGFPSKLITLLAPSTPEVRPTCSFVQSPPQPPGIWDSRS